MSQHAFHDARFGMAAWAREGAYALRPSRHPDRIRCPSKRPPPHLEEFAGLRLQPFGSVHQHDGVVGGSEGPVRVL